MNMRKFGTIFCIIIVVFLAISGGLLANKYFSASENTSDPNLSPTPTGNQNPVSSDDGPYNVLIFASESAKSNTDIIMVANYDPESNLISLLSIPNNLKADVTLDNGVRKIKSCYKTNGAEATTDLISNMFNISFKYYVYLDYNTIKTIVDSQNGIEFDLPVELNSTKELSGIDVSLPKGKQTLDSNKVNQFLRFTQPTGNRYSPELLSYYDGSNLSRTKMTQNLFKEYFVQKFNTQYLKDSETLYNQIKDKIVTNITLDDVKSLVAKSEDINVQRVRTYILSGTEQNQGNFYFMYDNKIKESDTDRLYNANDIINSYFKSSTFVTRKK